MSEQDISERIIAFARHCGSDERAPVNVAQRRGWLDSAGSPTEDGRALIDALDEQGETRTVFRTVP